MHRAALRLVPIVTGALVACASSRARESDAARDVIDPMVEVATCPERGAAWRLESAGTFSVGGSILGLSASGDGERVMFVVRRGTHPRTRLAVYEVAGNGVRGRVVWESDRDEDLGALDVSSGIGRLLRLGADGNAEVVELGPSSIRAVGATPPWSGPVYHHVVDWNGERLVTLAWDDDFRKWLWGFDPSSRVPWADIGFSFDVGLAGEADALATHVVVREGDHLVHTTLASTGAVLSRQPLEDFGSDGGLSVGYLPRSAEPLLVVTPTRHDDLTYHATVQRFRRDGTAGTRIDFPTALSWLHATDVPVRGLEGFGVVASGFRTPSLSFVGMVDGIAAEVLTNEAACVGGPDGTPVQIAAGPCGYVLFCADTEVVRAFVAVPPAS